MLTIGYCRLLSKRLQRLKADEHSLKATIAEVITATEIAERAIGGLKHAVRDVNGSLGNQLDAATQMSALLKTQLAEGDAVVRRLSQDRARGAAVEPEPAPRRRAAPAAPAAPAPRGSPRRGGGRGGLKRSPSAEGRRPRCMKWLP